MDKDPGHGVDKQGQEGSVPPRAVGSPAIRQLWVQPVQTVIPHFSPLTFGISF